MCSSTFNNTSILSKFIKDKKIIFNNIRKSHTHSKNIYTELNLLYLKNQRKKYNLELDEKIKKIVNEELKKIDITVKISYPSISKINNNSDKLDEKIKMIVINELNKKIN